MDSTTIVISLIVLVALLILYYYFYQKDKKSLPPEKEAAAPVQPASGTQTLQLAAYERLVILADRIAIPNLISRSSEPGLTKTDMQQLLTQTIKQEYEHNISQQIYVSADVWEG